MSNSVKAKTKAKKATRKKPVKKAVKPAKKAAAKKPVKKAVKPVKKSASKKSFVKRVVAKKASGMKISHSGIILGRRDDFRGNARFNQRDSRGITKSSTIVVLDANTIYDNSYSIYMYNTEADEIQGLVDFYADKEKATTIKAVAKVKK